MSNLIDNIQLVYKRPELDFTLKPKDPSKWELYLEKRYKELDKCVDEYHALYLILQKIINLVKSGKGITDKKVKYLMGKRWEYEK